VIVTLCQIGREDEKRQEVVLLSGISVIKELFVAFFLVKKPLSNLDIV